jgi:hypothetical protein
VRDSRTVLKFSTLCVAAAPQADPTPTLAQPFIDSDIPLNASYDNMALASAAMKITSPASQAVVN